MEEARGKGDQKSSVVVDGYGTSWTDCMSISMSSKIMSPRDMRQVKNEFPDIAFTFNYPVLDIRVL